MSNCKHPDKQHKLCAFDCKDKESCIRMNTTTDTRLGLWMKNVRRQDIKITFGGKDDKTK